MSLEQEQMRRLVAVEELARQAHSRIDNLDEGLNDRIELRIRRHAEKAGRSNRDMSGWVISLIAFALFVLFGLIDLALTLT